MPSPAAAAHHKTSTYTPGPCPPHLRFTYFKLLLLCVAAIISPTGTVSGLDPANRDKCPKASSFTPNMAASKEEADLKVLVPNITSLRQFVDCSDPANVHGFSIDVFQMALSILTPPPAPLPPNFSIHYTCFNFSASPGSVGPTYDTMVQAVSNEDFHVVVGDVTIGAYRQSMVDFSQKYMESGMVIVRKVATTEDLSPWLFFASPFSWRLWCTIIGAFAFIAFIICYFEKDTHPEFIQGPTIQRVSNILWFSLETLVLLDRESLKSTTAHGAMLAWIFFVVLLTASYTAGLSSFLTAQNLSPSTQDILSLRDSGKKIGFRRGSIAKDLLTQRYHVPTNNLVALRMTSEFVNNLTNGGVSAIVDELPYANLILSNMSDCQFAIAGPQLTQEGFGFGFNKTSNLESPISIALMNLTESGCLQELQSNAGMTRTSSCSSESALSNKVAWKSTMALFVPLLAVLCISLLVHYWRRCCFRRGSHHNEGRAMEDDSLAYIHSSITHRHPGREIELQHDSY